MVYLTTYVSVRLRRMPGLDQVPVGEYRNFKSGCCMQRLRCFLVGFFLCVAMAGCAICQNPYDDCNPAYGGNCACGGHSGGRVGSVFGASGGTAPSSETVYADVGQPTGEIIESDPGAREESVEVLPSDEFADEQ